MADFRDAFNAGITAADRAEANRLEISEVFDELNEQLKELTQGKILIERVERSKLKHKLDIFGERTYYTVISAINPEVDSSEELAQWKQDRSGYPCKIVLGEDEIYCDDRTALEEGLSILLKDAVVGESLKKLMRLEPKNQENNSSA